jgi:2-alkyl-3-oxoalkanoate reductase
MRIFLTGATGVIGQRVVPALVMLGHQVTAVGRTEEKRAGLRAMGAEAVAVDLFNAVAVQRAVAGHEAICNLATAVPTSLVRIFLPSAWREMDRVRREISANLVAAALANDNVHTLIQESFAPIYPDSGDAWIDETSPVRPARYNRSVLDAEAQAERFSRAGRTGIVLRFAGFYGAGDPFTRQMIDSIRRGWSPLLGRPDGFCSWVAHDDAATAVVAALGVPAGVYNVVEDDPMRRRDLANGMAELLGVQPPRFLPAAMARMAGPVGETLARSLRLSNRKLRAVSEWRPCYRTPIAGLRAILGEESGLTRPAA